VSNKPTTREAKTEVKVFPGVAIRRRKVDMTLREAAHIYLDLVKSINDVIYATDEEGIITYISPAIESVAGYSPKDIIGRHLGEFVHEQDLPRITELFGKVISGRTEPWEYRILTKSGETRWVRTSSRAIMTNNQRIEVRGILTDITDRKRAEERREKLLKELEEALTKVRTLSGLLPICSSCKKIRDDRGYWNQIEAYIRDHSEAEFSHSICPDCVKELYSDVDWKDRE
jgi:PAS domain S-box-containing protein